MFMRFLICLFLAIQGVNAQIDTIRIGYYEEPPFVQVQEDSTLQGLAYWMWQRATIADSINVEYVNFSQSESPLHDLLGAIDGGQVDMALNPLTITGKRNAIMEFSTPVYVSNLTIAARSSSGVKKVMGYLDAFFSMAFLESVLALFVVIFIFGFIVWLLERNHPNSSFRGGIKGMFMGIWWSAVTMTTVGYGDTYPRTVGGKLIGLVWMFTAIVIISGFTASIATSLTVNRLQESVSELSDFKERKVGTVESSATEAYLKQSFFKRVKGLPDLPTALDSLKLGNLDAVIYDEPILRQMLQTEIRFEGLSIVPLRFNTELYAFAFRKNFSPEFLQRINQKIIQIRETREWEIVLKEHQLSEI